MHEYQGTLHKVSALYESALSVLYPFSYNLFIEGMDTLFIMFENIAFIVMAVIAASAGIWVWWLENHSQDTGKKSNLGDKTK